MYMEKEQALRLLAEGKTGEAIDCLLNSINKDYKGKKFSDAHLEIVFISNQFRRVEKDFLRGFIEYKDFSSSANMIALSLLNFIKSQGEA